MVLFTIGAPGTETHTVLDRTKETQHHLYHEDGKTLIELGELYQRSPGTVWGWFKKHGISTRSVKEAAERKDRAVSKMEIAQMRELYNQGLSSNDIGKQLGRDGRLVRVHLEGELRERAEAVRLAVDNGKIRSPDVQVEDDFFAALTDSIFEIECSRKSLMTRDSYGA